MENYRVKKTTKTHNGRTITKFFPQRKFIGIWLCYPEYPCGSVSFNTFNAAKFFIEEKILDGSEEKVEYYDV